MRRFSSSLSILLTEVVVEVEYVRNSPYVCVCVCGNYHYCCYCCFFSTVRVVNASFFSLLRFDN